MRKIIKGRRRTVILTGKPATGVYKEDAKIESTAKSLAKKNPQNYKKCPRCGKTISSNAKKYQPHRLPRPNNFLRCE